MSESLKIKIAGKFMQIDNILVPVSKIQYVEAYTYGAISAHSHGRSKITIRAKGNSWDWWFGKATDDPVLIARNKQESVTFFDRIVNALELHGQL